MKPVVAAERFSVAARVALPRVSLNLVGEVLYSTSEDTPAITKRWLEGAGIPLKPAGLHGGPAEGQFATEANDLLAGVGQHLSATDAAKIEALLQRERDYAERSGSTAPIRLSLSRFARRWERSEPVRAIRWAAESVAWDPLDDFGWTALIRAYRAANEIQQALDSSYRAVRRFPSIAPVWIELGLSLRSAHHHRRGEQVLRVAVDRFPTNERLCDLLAYMLRVQRRLDEAEDFYRKALTLSAEGNQHSWDGLIVVLALQDRFGEALSLVSSARELFPDNSRFLAREQELERESIDEPTYPEASSDPSATSAEARLQEARIVRFATRLEEGHGSTAESESGRLLSLIQDSDPMYRPRIALERALTDIGVGRTAEAEARVESALRSYPTDTGLLHASATLRRTQLREAGQQFSDSSYQWLVTPLAQLEASNPALGPLGAWSRLVALAVTADGDEWRTARAEVLRTFDRRIVAANTVPLASNDGFVRLWSERVQSHGAPVLSETLDREEALARASSLATFDEEYALLGSSA